MEIKLPKWFASLIEKYGDKAKVPAGASKHNRARMKPRDWRHMRKVRRQMAVKSRRRNTA